MTVSGICAACREYSNSLDYGPETGGDALCPGCRESHVPERVDFRRGPADGDRR